MRFVIAVLLLSSAFAVPTADAGERRDVSSRNLQLYGDWYSVQSDWRLDANRNGLATLLVVGAIAAACIGLSKVGGTTPRRRVHRTMRYRSTVYG